MITEEILRSYTLLFELKKTRTGTDIVITKPLVIAEYNHWSKLLYEMFLEIKSEYSLVSAHHIAVHFSFLPKAYADSASSFALARMIQGLIHTGVKVDIQSLPMEVQNHLKYRPQPVPQEKRRSFQEFLFEELGRGVLTSYIFLRDLLGFVGYSILKFGDVVQGKNSFPWASFVNSIEQVGLRACPIIALISFLIGMVLAYQGIIQLGRFGAEIYTVDFLAIGVLREIGVLLTAIVVAGRSSSAFTAQIGIMNLNQEIDAMRVMQLDPFIYLVIPRVLALLVALPLLVFLSNVMAFVGGMLTTQLTISLSPLHFIDQLEKALSIQHFWVGMSKAPLFAIIIGFVGCFRGMQVRESAESVGKMTTASVVDAIFLVIVVNAFMSILFSYLKV